MDLADDWLLRAVAGCCGLLAGVVLVCAILGATLLGNRGKMAASMAQQMGAIERVYERLSHLPTPFFIGLFLSYC